MVVDGEGAALVLCATVNIKVALVHRLIATVPAGTGLGAWVRPSLPLAADTHVTKRNAGTNTHDAQTNPQATHNSLAGSALGYARPSTPIYDGTSELTHGCERT
jgi:hypothetical protein